jgi:hypothetical protein
VEALMGVLGLVAYVAIYDLAAKALGQPTITAELRRNRPEALLGVAWLAVHVARRDRP